MYPQTNQTFSQLRDCTRTRTGVENGTCVACSDNRQTALHAIEARAQCCLPIILQNNLRTCKINVNAAEKLVPSLMICNVFLQYVLFYVKKNINFRRITKIVPVMTET